MRRLIPILILFGLVFMAACNSKETQTPTLESSAIETIPTDTLVPATAEVIQPTTPPTTAVMPVGFVKGEPMPGCTASSMLPPPDPTAASLFPAASEGDWTIGKSDAAVSIIEYGDFQ